jgi:hypothetical protein
MSSFTHVSEPDTKVLDLEGLLFADLLMMQLRSATLCHHFITTPATHHIDSDNLAGCLLHLTQLSDEVPEPRFLEKSKL